jgi:hypothetical protein
MIYFHYFIYILFFKNLFILSLTIKVRERNGKEKGERDFFFFLISPPNVMQHLKYQYIKNLIVILKDTLYLGEL